MYRFPQKYQRASRRRSRLHSKTYVDPLRNDITIWRSLLSKQREAQQRNRYAARRGFAANVIDIPGGRLALR